MTTKRLNPPPQGHYKCPHCPYEGYASSFRSISVRMVKCPKCRSCFCSTLLEALLSTSDDFVPAVLFKC